MKSMRSLVWQITLSCVVGGLPLAAAPTPVSPGDDGGTARVGTACPTFSWGGAAAGGGFELVVYRAEHNGVASTPVLRRSLPTGASSWTPALDECLEPGGRYAWAVRQAVRGGSGDEWSEARLFEVASTPSAAEVERALAILAAYRAEGGPTAEADTLAAEEFATSRAAQEAPAPDAVAELLGPASSVEVGGGGTTAITGIVSDPTGVNVGVHGSVASNGIGASGVLAQATATTGVTFGAVVTAASPDGSALALGSLNGADLVLSSGGVFGVDGAGNVEATSFAGEGSGLTGVVTGDDTVTSAKIVDGTITRDDVNSTGGIYTSKNQIDQNFNTVVLAPGDTGQSTVTCDDANDLPIGIACSTNNTSNPKLLHHWSLTNWTNESTPAGVICRMENTGVFDLDVVAMILCVPVS